MWVDGPKKYSSTPLYIYKSTDNEWVLVGGLLYSLLELLSLWLGGEVGSDMYFTPDPYW